MFYVWMISLSVDNSIPCKPLEAHIVKRAFELGHLPVSSKLAQFRSL